MKCHNPDCDNELTERKIYYKAKWCTSECGDQAKYRKRRGDKSQTSA